MLKYKSHKLMHWPAYRCIRALAHSRRKPWHHTPALRSTLNARLLIHELFVLPLPQKLFEHGLFGILLMILSFTCWKIAESKHFLKCIVIQLVSRNDYLGLSGYFWHNFSCCHFLWSFSLWRRRFLLLIIAFRGLFPRYRTRPWRWIPISSSPSFLLLLSNHFLSGHWLLRLSLLLFFPWPRSFGMFLMMLSSLSRCRRWPTAVLSLPITMLFLVTIVTTNWPPLPVMMFSHY